MDGPDSARQALNGLEASLKRVLLHTGSALITASGNGGTQVEASRRDLQKTLPEALTQWHDGLAVLEKQLATSKAILHRDLARLRSAKQAEQEPQQASPARSLGSDTVMVDLPTQDQTVTNGAPVRGQATAQISSSDMEKDNVTKQDSTVEPHTTPAPQQRDNGDLQAQPSQPEQQPSTNHTNTPGEFTSSKEAAQKDESKSRADSPMPSIETAQGVGNDQAGDPTNDFANADVGSLLPGLMDYANGADGATGEGLDLQNELTSGNLFSNDALQGTDGELGTGSGNLFGEGNLPADGAADDFDNQNAGFDFANMNFAVGDGSFGPDAEHGTSEEFDFSKLGQDFFNI